MHDSTIIQRALLTVSDKSHLLELAEGLHLRGVEIISTGNTANVLKEHGIPVITVNEYTGFPEMMDGRLKTLHPKIFGGILARRDVDTDAMVAHNIPDIDLVVVNLYPFGQVSQDKNATMEQIVENIDIGGPSLIRAAAKNYEWCTVLVSPDDYKSFLADFNQNKGTVSFDSRLKYAAKAFEHTAQYESLISEFFRKKNNEKPTVTFDATLNLQFKLKEELRYGENPQDSGAFYALGQPAPDSIAGCVQLQGKTLSYNNILDADTALECVKSFALPSCVIVKHANPCGVASSESPLQAYQKAYQCDPTSAFGGIIAFNRDVDEKLIKTIFENQFVEVIIATSFSLEAQKIAQQKENCRLLEYSNIQSNVARRRAIHSVNGGILIQEFTNDHPPFEIVSKRQPSAQEMQDLEFGWQLVKWVKSNAIVFVKNQQSLGVGAGQMSRIFSTEIAAMKAAEAQLSLQGAVMASDAFFPFKDNVEKAHELGITAIIQPGGAKRDMEIIECANQFNMAMVFTNQRCFRH